MGTDREAEDASRWRVLFEHSTTAMAVLDAEGTFEQINPAFEALFGRGRDALIGTPSRALLAPQVEGAAIDEDAQQLVTTCSHPTGGAFAVDVETVRTDAGTRLVTVRELSEDALGARDLDRFFDLSDDLLCIATTDGYFKRVSRSFTELLGHSEEVLLSRPFSEWIHPGDRDVTRHELSNVATGKPTHDFENRYRCADGSWRTLWWRSQPVPEEGLVYAVARDVTDERAAQAAIAHYGAELQRSNQDLEQFAYVASHDLQEPLRMVVSYTELLARRYEGQLDERADKYIRYAVEGGKRMQALIDGLLAFSRVARRTAAMEDFDAREAVDAATANLKRSIRDHSAVVHVEPLPVVHADRAQLVSVMQNLLANAIHFHAPDEPPRVAIGGLERDDEIELFVRDHGIGIPEAQHGRVFEIFKRLHTRQEYEGTGIGLAISKRIVERHGGRIWIEPTEGGGATFRFTLPRRESSSNREEEEELQ